MNDPARSEPRQRTSFDSIAKLVQVLAIVAAGVWGLYEYVSFRKEHDQLILAQSRFAVEQQGILKDQQALAVEMAKIQVESERVRRQMAEVELASAKASRLALKNDLDVIFLGGAPDGFGEYRARLRLEVKNISKETLEVTFSVVEYFIGTLSRMEMARPYVVPINLPSATFRPEESGVVRWDRVGISTYSVGDSRFSEYREVLSGAGIDPNKTSGSGGAVGGLKPDEEAIFTGVYLVRAPRESWLAFSLAVGINGGGESGDLWVLKNFQYLKGIGAR